MNNNTQKTRKSGFPYFTKLSPAMAGKPTHQKKKWKKVAHATADEINALLE